MIISPSLFQDENLHSGADVEAFTAALNRDIGGGGGDTLVSQSVDSDAGNIVQLCVCVGG